jgi:hypothetical protein
MCEGIVDELQGIHLGDRRLNERSVKVIEALAADPQASVNGAVNGWADTQAAYRFFNNPQVTPEQILLPHRQATVRRMQQQAVVLLLQDTTELDYTAHPPRDAGRLDRWERRGWYQHVELAVTPGRLPLGVVATESFDRDPDEPGVRQTGVRRTGEPIEDKESFRWLKGYRHAGELATECPATHVISVADCEADLYDIFVEAQCGCSAEAAPSHRRADYIIRAKQNRCTPERDPAAPGNTFRKVRDQVGAAPLLTTLTIELSETPKRANRQALLQVRALTVTVKPPHARSSLPPITHNVVLVEELDGPGDGTDVSWLLLTTLPIATIDEVLRIVDSYVARWSIETYFRTLKTGCQVEELQLETKSRLLNCLAFYQIIAWRIIYLTHLNRTCPELPCTAVFADHEWKPVWRVVRRSPLPKHVPTLNEFLQLLTHLGGYNNRAKEPPPGPQPVWTGLRRMLDFSIAWLAFGPEDTENCV